VTLPTVSYHLRRLEDESVIERGGETRSRRTGPLSGSYVVAGDNAAEACVGWS
jgi:DNA-binding transcriptional ArsR family regulator